MAKEKFERTKPHVAATARSLKKLGISEMGAIQIAQGQIVTNPSDREILAQLVVQATGSGGNTTTWNLMKSRL